RQREDACQELQQRRPRFQQVEQVDRAGQVGKQLLPAQEGALRLGRGGERGQERKLDRVESGQRRIAAQGPQLARSPAGDAFGKLVRFGEAQLRQLFGQIFFLGRERDCPVGDRICRNQR